MNNTPVRFAIVGTGTIADFHAQAIQQIAQARLVAVQNRSFGKAQAFAEKYGVVAMETLEELLRKNDVDVVCVTTPSGEHAVVAIEALQAGKHVLCEKPLEVSLEKVEAMRAAARSGGALLSAVFQARFGDGAQRLKRAVVEGRFGRLTLSSCHVKYWRDQAYYDSGGWRGTWAMDGGGALMNQGIHAIDLLQWYLGMPEEVLAMTGTLAHERIETEDTAAALLRFQSGALAVVEGATSTWPGFRRRIEISGDKGSAILEDDVLRFWQFQDELPEDAAIRDACHRKAEMASGAADPKAISVEGHRRQIQDLVTAIQKGGKPSIDGDEARNAVEIILGIYESARTGQPVRLMSGKTDKT